MGPGVSLTVRAERRRTGTGVYLCEEASRHIVEGLDVCTGHSCLS